MSKVLKYATHTMMHAVVVVFIFLANSWIFFFVGKVILMHRKQNESLIDE